MSKDVKDLFNAEAASLWDTMTSHAGVVGFKVPEYQREYDWDERNLRRLLEDCMHGFSMSSQPHRVGTHTFLGTLILVNEESSEATFDGRSLLIVDGQQRLTTLTLLI